jgi:hypothetical protein
MNDRSLFHPSSFRLHPSIGVCSWESSEPPKLADRVRILAPLLICLLPLECDGIACDPPKVVDQVRLLARALFQPFLASVMGARRSSKPQGRVRFPGGGFSLYQVLGV